MARAAKRRRSKRKTVSDDDDEYREDEEYEAAHQPHESNEGSLHDDDTVNEPPMTEDVEHSERSESSHKVASHTRELIIGDIVKLAIAANCSRSTLKKSTIYSEIISQRVVGGRNQSIYKEVFPQVQDFLEQNFGMQLVSAPDAFLPHSMRNEGVIRSNKKNDDNSGPLPLTDPSKADVLMLTSILPEPYRKLACRPKVAYDNVYMGAVFVVVVFIVMHRGLLKRNTLETTLLPQTGLDENIFGEKYESLLSKMKDDRYVLSRKIAEQTGEEPKEFLCLGPRAQKEYTKEGLARVLSKLFDGSFDPASYFNTVNKAGDLKLYSIEEFVPQLSKESSQTNNS